MQVEVFSINYSKRSKQIDARKIKETMRKIIFQTLPVNKVSRTHK
jgi:hypothetical protein